MGYVAHRRCTKYIGAFLAMILSLCVASAQDLGRKSASPQKPAPPKTPAIIAPVAAPEDFASVMNRMVEATAPYYTDNLMHNLQVERFFKPKTINGRMANADGPIKTFPLRGIKDSPPYLHDGRLLTLDDTVDFFNLILELKLTANEKTDLVAFMRVL